MQINLKPALLVLSAAMVMIPAQVGYAQENRNDDQASILVNNYWGTDTLGNPDRKRIHTDDSVQWKYYDKPDAFLDKAAMTFTFDAGCEYGGGVSCGGGTADTPSQTFLGFMTYQRVWFNKDLFAVTVGGGAINNPGRYLVLVPPINGATAFSGTPYFTASPGDPYKAWACRRRSTTCQVSSSRFARNTTIVQRTCRTSPGQAASPRPEAIPARRDRSCRVGRRTCKNPRTG